MERTSVVTAITGAASGIGEATARTFAARGAVVAILDVDGDRADHTAESIRAHGGSAEAWQTDVSDEDSVTDAFRQVRSRFGRIDAVHANAAVESVGALHELTLSDWRRTIGVNLTGAFLTIRASLEIMREQRSGSIVATASTLAVLAAAETAAYSASKGGLLAMVRVAAVEAAPFGIRVNAILPGAIDTPMLRREAALVEDSEGQRRRFAAISPFARLGSPQEVAEAVWFLCSPEASFITGVALPIDGGVSAVQSTGAALTYTSYPHKEKELRRDS